MSNNKSPTLNNSVPSHVDANRWYKIVGVLCAAAILLVQTFTNGVNSIGYDDVIEAHAEVLAFELRSRITKKHDMDRFHNTLKVLQKELVQQKVDNIIRFEKLESMSHEKSNK